MVTPILQWIHTLRLGLSGIGTDVSLLLLRLIMAHEFWEAGAEKLNGSNWFSGIQEQFPFPFNAVPAELSWWLATWTELAAAVLLVFGLFTRFAAFSLLILTGVAIASVHWPESWSSLSELWQGFVISNKGQGNFYLPLLFAVMLVPLVFQGPGRLSADALLARWLLQSEAARSDAMGADGVSLRVQIALVLLVLGLPLAQVMPLAGWTMVLVGAAIGAAELFLSSGAGRSAQAAVTTQLRQEA